MSDLPEKGFLVRVFTWLFVLFALPYGAIFVSIDLSSTIGFKTVEEAAAARRVQLFYCIPYIIFGVILLVVLIVYYVSRKRKRKVLGSFWYGMVVAGAGVICTAGITWIAFYIQEPSLVLCIVPAFCLLLYGGVLIFKNRKKRVSGR